MNKKKLFGIILFIIIGLFTFTFANPNEKIEDTGKVEDTEKIEDNKTKEQENNTIVEDQKPVVKEENELKKPEQVINNINKENIKILDLKQIKLNAIEELKKYQQNLNLTENITANKIVEEAIKNINNANTTEIITNIVKEAKSSLDKIIENQLREKAIEEIENYKKDELYSEENQNKINEIKNNATNNIRNTEKDNITNIVEEAKKQIDNILTQKETSYSVLFIDMNDKIIKEEKVMYGKSAVAPEVENIEQNGITYSFKSWNKEYTNVISNLEIKANYDIIKVQASVYNEILISTVELNINNEITEAITNNINTVLTTEENKIISFSKDKLPTLDKLNYKYNYYELSYSKNGGFRIEAKEVIDEEALKNNTVTITYNIDSEIATFIDGTKQQQSTTYTGSNNVELKDVYVNGKKVAVIWTDENGNIISEVSENKVALKEKLNYNKSMILTANLDTTAPVITLNGETNINVDLTYVNEYEEAGYTAIDNFNGDITQQVTTSITLNDIPTNQVDYSKEGKYVITYTVTDTEGNTSSVTRTINVIDKITEIKATILSLKEGITRPINDKLDIQNYNKIGEVNLVVDKARKYVETGKNIISTSEIESYVLGGIESLPKTNEKYYSYEYYILRHEEDGFYIECEKIFDEVLYKNDKLKELNDLLNKDYTNYKETKTSETYQNLIDTISNIKNNMPTKLEEIEKDINKIKDAITSLVDVVLINISLSSNNDTYIVNSAMKQLTVTAIYNDSTKNKVLTKNEYKTNTPFDSKTIGNKSIIYSYKDKNVVYSYKVEYSKEQLQEKVNPIEIKLEEKISLSKIEYKIVINSIGKNINIKGINIIKNGNTINTINFTKKSDNIYLLNKNDYFTLVNNNTTVGNKKINITYQIDNQEITVSYYEAFNKLHKCK